MSTRSQILFRQGKSKVMIYRHSDGYPTGALGDLVSFFQWNQGRNTDLSYMTANYIYFMKKDSEAYCDYDWKADKSTGHYELNWKDEKYAKDGNLSTKLGYGIVDSDSIGSWTEYFYDVELMANTHIVIKCYSVSNSDDESVTKFLKHANLIQTVTLVENGSILSNIIIDKEESEPFKELVAQ
jgi:hypothetical protein